MSRLRRFHKRFVKLQTATCPTCRRDVPLSRWTGRIKLHVGSTAGEVVFCKTGRYGMYRGTT